MVGTEADFSTPWVILRTNINVTFPPDVGRGGWHHVQCVVWQRPGPAATGNGGEWLPETTDTAGGNIILVPEAPRFLASPTACLAAAGGADRNPGGAWVALRQRRCSC